jgi:ubiquinone/menaquinone biosynthesis C-methylase UbiE
MRVEKVLNNSHYCYFYTNYFDLDIKFYTGKKILDVGCGPRGSLAWAVEADERIGLDSLATEYLAMGADRHNMQYVDAPAEAIPFPANHFDVVCSFNSLDHVKDLQKALTEIHRVLKPDGIFLLIVEINHPPTATEPIEIRDVDAVFGTHFEIQSSRKYEIGDLHDIYGQIRSNSRFDELDHAERPAILTAKLIKRISI